MWSLVYLSCVFRGGCSASCEFLERKGSYSSPLCSLHVGAQHGCTPFLIILDNF